MEKILFIINPKSGVDRVKALKGLIDEHLDKSKFESQIAHTEYAKHGTLLAKKGVEKGFSIIVAVGGDGSVNDIIVGLQGTSATLAIIPKGSGNGLARSLGIPLDAVKAVKVINNNRRVEIDLGMANKQIFASNIGVGFDALVAKKFTKSSRRGMLVYSWIVTKYLWKYKEWEWEIDVDGAQFKERAFILTVANAQQFGYNFKIAPVADLQDGIFDIVIIRKYPKILGLIIAIRAFRGTILKSKYVRHLQGKSIIIRHPKLDMMQSDGDVHPCQNEINVTILPSALKVIVP